MDLFKKMVNIVILNSKRVVIGIDAAAAPLLN
jgi:hypothetical protein